MYLLAPDGRPAAREVIQTEICVVGDEIYSSPIYQGTVQVVKMDDKGNPTDKNEAYFDGLTKDFGYNDDNINWAAKNFYTNWIQKMKGTSYSVYRSTRARGQRIISPDYTNPRYIEIKDKKSMVMRYYNSGKDIELGKEDGGLLYVPEPGKVCLFATTGDVGIFDCDAHVEGLEQDCLDTKSEVDALVSAVSSCQK